jgi:hypothetical protein
VQLSFQLWTKQMQEILSAKKRGDTAFREKDFKEAIISYTQVPNLSHVAKFCYPLQHTAF